MSDLDLFPTDDGGDITVTKGKPTMTGGLRNAVYLSLFTGPWWGNAISTPSEKFDSDIPRIMQEENLTNDTRNDVIKEAERVLAWMITDGLADEITVDAEIPEPGRLYISVKIDKPNCNDPLSIAFGATWEDLKIDFL